MSEAPRDGSLFYGRVDIGGGEFWIPGVRWDEPSGLWWEHYKRPVERALLEWAR